MDGVSRLSGPVGQHHHWPLTHEKVPAHIPRRSIRGFSHRARARPTGASRSEHSVEGASGIPHSEVVHSISQVVECETEWGKWQPAPSKVAKGAVVAG